MKSNVLIYGLGAFGFAMLRHLDRFGQARTAGWLAGYEAMGIVQSSLHTTKKHPTLYIDKSYTLSVNVFFPTEPQDTIQQADIIILAIPAHVLLDVRTTKIKPYCKKNVIILNLAKGLQPDGTLFSQAFAQQGYLDTYAMLAGGMIAEDFFDGHPLGCTIATRNPESCEKLTKHIASPTLFVETTNDIIGVECAAAYKNVAAILIGWLTGKGYPFGTSTYAMTSFSRDIAQFTEKVYGGQAATFGATSQCRGSDFVMSCLGNTRNRAFGEILGKGMPFSQAEQQMKIEKKTVEGIQTLRILDKLLQQTEEDFPLLRSCTKLLTDEMTIL